MAAIFLSSEVSQPPAMPGELSDKTAHFWVYAGFAVVLVRALAKAAWTGVTGSRSLAAAVGATVYGAIDEVHQRFVPERLFEFADITYDAFGALAGVGVVLACAIIHRHVVHEPASRA